MNKIEPHKGINLTEEKIQFKSIWLDWVVSA
jgi:hypothetical protein